MFTEICVIFSEKKLEFKSRSCSGIWKKLKFSKLEEYYCFIKILRRHRPFYFALCIANIWRSILHFPSIKSVNFLEVWYNSIFSGLPGGSTTRTKPSNLTGINQKINKQIFFKDREKTNFVNMTTKQTKLLLFYISFNLFYIPKLLWLTPKPLIQSGCHFWTFNCCIFGLWQPCWL